MKFLSPIKNLNTATKIDEILSWAVRCQSKPRGLSEEIVLFKLTGWIAVPMTPETFYDFYVLKHIKNTLQAHGYNQLYAVKLFTKDYDSYIVPVSCEGLDEFRRALGYCCSALFIGELEPDWVIISLESEFYVMAGPVDFVSQILPWGIEEAFSRFQNFVLHEQMLREMKPYLQRVYEQLKNNYQKAEFGEEFRLSYE